MTRWLGAPGDQGGPPSGGGARRGRGAGMVALLGLAVATAGFSPFRAEEPNVREGNERQAAGKPQEALPHYDAAERAVGPRAEIEYDRGVALLGQGKSTEARDAFRRALERGAGELSSRAHQNLGSALDATGDREGAIAAFTEALRLDPKNEDARFDLEVLLRRKEAEARRQQQQGQQQQRKQQQQRQADGRTPQDQQGKANTQPQGAPKGAAQQPEREAPPAPERQAQARDAGPTRPDDERQGQARESDPARLSREDAARILDAFRAREQTMPLGGDERRKTRRGDADRDW